MPALKRAHHPTISYWPFFALVVGLLGAIFDHHFAERQPRHDHIFPNHPGTEHHHHYGLDHHRSSDHSSQPDHSIASIGANHASAAYWVLVSLVLAMLLYVPLTIEHPGIVRRLLLKTRRLSPVFHPPPDRPPAYL